MSAFFWYLKENREEVGEGISDASGISKVLRYDLDKERANYDALDIAEKEKYEELARVDRLRYFKEKRELKAARKPPKRARSAFSYFSKEVFDIIRTTDPNAI